MTNDSSLFVFYTMDKGGSWEYSLPGKWWWVGSGTVNPVKGEKVSNKYLREEQFGGPRSEQSGVRSYLDSYFQKLKTKNVVLRYQIRDSFRPVPD